MLLLTFIAIGFAVVVLTTFFRSVPGTRQRRACLFALIAWLVYAIYEGVYIREWLTTIYGAPIRADLLVIGIVLAVLTKRALWPNPEVTISQAYPAPSSKTAEHFRTCSRCGHVGPMKTWLRNYNTPQLIALVLLSLMLVPGIIFISWAWGKYKCPRCNRVGRHDAA